MRFSEILKESAGLSFNVDNPGGEWLKDEQERCIASGKNQHGAPKRFGAVTGYFSRKVLLPVDILSMLDGVMGEQHNTRHDDLNWLVDYMGTNNHLPVENGQQYAPFVTVDMNGNAWVSEGNHRIKAARKLNWHYLPVEIRYYAGAEKVFGTFSPSQVKQYDARAMAEGFSPNNEFRGTLGE